MQGHHAASTTTRTGGAHRTPGAAAPAPPGASVAPEVLDRWFRALADRTRRDILTHAASAPASVSALARRFPMSVAAVQKHVAVLEDAGLVTTHRRGRERLVHVDAAGLERVGQAFADLERLWRGRLRAMEVVLTGAAGDGGGRRRR